MKKANWLLSILLIVSLVSCSEKQETAIDQPSSADSAAKPSHVDSITVELTGVDSMSVFDLLRENHQVDVKSSAMGVFVQAIDSITNSDDAYWMYSVNDSMGQVASDKYITADGDLVRWHFRKFSE